LSSHDKIIRKHLVAGPGNAKFKHHSVPDALLKIMADMILCEIREVWKASFFSIICDETKDLSEKEQLSVDVRYFYAAKLTKNFSVSVLLKASLLRLLLNTLQ